MGLDIHQRTEFTDEIIAKCDARRCSLIRGGGSLGMWPRRLREPPLLLDRALLPAAMP